MSFLARVSQRLIALSTGRVTLVALAIFLLFMVLVLPRQSAQSQARTGGGAQPDMSFIYSPGDLYRMAEAFGPEGRQAYVRARWTFDLIFPLVYGFFLATSIAWLACRAFRPTSRWRLLTLAPIVGMVFDYLENITASIVIARYPTPTPVVDLLAPVFTATKWVFVGGSFLVLLGVAAAAVASRTQGKRVG